VCLCTWVCRMPPVTRGRCRVRPVEAHPQGREARAHLR
jgi:hypothetical protein